MFIRLLCIIVQVFLFNECSSGRELVTPFTEGNPPFGVFTYGNGGNFYSVVQPNIVQIQTILGEGEPEPEPEPEPHQNSILNFTENTIIFIN